MGELPPELLQWMRFSPSHEKAIEILISKITGNRKEPDFIFEAEKSNLEPLQLKHLCLNWLDSCGIKIKYPEWWFFSPGNRKGKGMERTTQSGFWKVTCQPTNFMLDSVLIGKKDILVFYAGRGKEGKRTNWKIHQYQVTLKELDSSHPGQRPFVLSRLFYDDESLVQHLKSTGLAVPSGLPALEVQATTTPENFGKTISSTITPVDCDGKNFSSHAAENQFGKLTATEDDLQQEEVEEMINELLQRPVDFEILAPPPSLHNNSAVSHLTTANSSLEELESKQAFALESPSSEEQSDNYLRKGHPEEIFDGTIATALSNCNQNGYNATTSEFQEGFGLSDLQVPLDRSLSSPLTSDMHFGMSHSVSNDYNNHCGTYSEYGMNELPKFGSTFPDLTSHYLSENFSNKFGCQKYLPLVSMKDNGSCSGSDAKMANEQEGLGLSDLQRPLDCNLSSPLTSDMRIGMSHSVSNDYNNHCGMYSQCGMNELPKFGSTFPDLTSDYLSENFSNTFGCQKNLPLVSTKDNGSCNGSDAKMANEQFQEGFGLSDLQVPLDCSLSLPLTYDMHFGMSHSISNDYNGHCGTSSEYGMNELSKFGDKFPDLASDYLSENFPNMLGCQKDLPLVSMKDNGSCSGLDAKLANTPFESTFQGSGESRKRKALSGLLNLESPHGINGKVFKSDLGSDFIPKNY